MKQIYIDGVNDVALIGGNVRMELVSFALDPDSDPQNPPFDTTARLVMSPDAMLRLYSSLKGLLDRMQERGVITREGLDEASQAISAASNEKKSGGAAAKKGGGSKSPNFS